jgi:DNA-binding transcriptional LysR family regulator
MQSLRSLISSPSALFAFEAAGRLGSFSAASKELNVTQAAVSFAVKQLEESLGVGLFLRSHKKIELTDVGERFFHDVSIGLTHIRRSAEEFRRTKRGEHVTMSVSTGFATYWMIPRLASFRATHPDIDLRVQASDKDVELTAEAIDLGIRRGDGLWPDYDVAMLAPEEIYPVCSAAYLAGRAGADLSTLANLDLIHLDEPFRPRPTWVDWLAAKGIDCPNPGGGLRLNDYALVLQAAHEGEGIALGWHHLVANSIRRGQLVRPIPESLVTGLGIFVCWAKRGRLSRSAARVRDWLLSQREDFIVGGP